MGAPPGIGFEVIVVLSHKFGSRAAAVDCGRCSRPAPAAPPDSAFHASDGAGLCPTAELSGTGRG